MPKGCGTCTLCCTLMRVEMAPRPEPAKPEGKPCAHLCRKGCGVYDERPQSCRDFECLWLLSQTRMDTPMPKFLRPDRTGVVLEVNTAQNVVAHCRGPNDWKRGGMGRFLRKLAAERPVIVDRGDIEAGSAANRSPLLLETNGDTTPLRFIGVDEVSNERKYVRGDLGAVANG